MASRQGETGQAGLAKPWRPLQWAGGFAALVAAVLAVAGWQASRPIVYKRYVSPPEADGTRYTFRYPATLGDTRTFSFPEPGPGGKTYTLHIVNVMTRLSPVESLAFRYRFLRQFRHANNFEIVRVTASDAPAVLRHPPPGVPVASPDGRYVRAERVESGRTEASHQVTVVDRRTRLRYTLSHDCYGADLPRRFARDDAAIAASFQVLPPGVLPPAR